MTIAVSGVSAGQINTSNIQEPISTTIDKYKKHSSILKTKKKYYRKKIMSGIWFNYK